MPALSRWSLVDFLTNKIWKNWFMTIFQTRARSELWGQVQKFSKKKSKSKSWKKKFLKFFEFFFVSA